MPIRLSCHCGAVALTVPAPPAEVGQCNCSICTKLAWVLGYYRVEEVTRLTPAANEDRYIRADEPNPCLAVHRCRTCGVATHWQPLEMKPDAKMGVNARLLEGVDLAAIPVRLIDGASW